MPFQAQRTHARTGGSRGGGGSTGVGATPPVSTLKARCGCIGHCSGSAEAAAGPTRLAATPALPLTLAPLLLLPSNPAACCC